MFGRNGARPGKSITAATILAISALALPAAASKAQIWGSPKFTVEQSDDRFTTDGMTSWISHGNRISRRSTAGGRHIDRLGVFFDPFAILNRSDGKLRSLGFTFINAYWRDNISGALLSIGSPLRVTFLTGEGEPIALAITSPRHVGSEAPHCDRVTLNCTTNESDLGTIDLTVEQYRRIMNATTLAVKIEGSERSWVYEAKDIDPKFLGNLKLFAQEHLGNVGS